MPESSFKRTILITGSTDGIGKQTATDLAAHPDNRVIIHGRSEEKCEATRDHIIKETGNPSNVDYIACDLSIMKEVAHFADQVKSRFPDLNVLLCNAGVLNPRRAETKDGLEMTFQVNYLSHFILCNRLLDTLERNKHGRIIVVGSVLHSWTALDWSDVMAKKDYEKYLVYSRSKLCLHLMAFALHRRMNIARRNLAVNVVELGKEREPNNNGKMRTTSALSSSMSTLSMCRAAGNLVQLIENPAFENLSGKYLDSTGKQIRSGAEATDERLQERLWAYSADLAKGYVNHLAHFVIARQLRPLLAKNAPARIVFTSSICHDWYPLDFSDLQATQYGDDRGYLQYSRSKLMNHMTALKMARDKSDGVNVNVYEPGVIETKLLKAGGYSGSSVKDSGYAAAQLTTSDDFKNISGEYFNNKAKKASSSADAKDVAQQDRIWKMSEEICAKFGITF